MQTSNLVVEQRYRLTDELVISNDGYDSVILPKGLILIHKGGSKKGWFIFETKDGIKVELWNNDELGQMPELEEVE